MRGLQDFIRNYHRYLPFSTGAFLLQRQSYPLSYYDKASFGSTDIFCHSVQAKTPECFDVLRRRIATVEDLDQKMTCDMDVYMSTTATDVMPTREKPQA